MAETFGERMRRLDDEKDRWFRDRSVQASRLQRDLENAGREAWSAATRAGVDLAARTPQELRALGARILDGRYQARPEPRAAGAAVSRDHQSRDGKPAAQPVQPSHLTKPSGGGGQAWRTAMQADAALRGAANVMTLGGADHFAAGMDALVGGGLDHWRQRYDANLAQERARDRFDALARSGAQAAGQIGGTLLGLGLVGPVDAALASAPRLAGTAALTGREAAAVLGGGALAGLGIQTVSDIAAGGRRSSLGDKAGAALGGAAGAAALPLGPGRAGAVAGWVTSAAQDAFNVQPISLKRAGESAIAGNLFGGLTGRAGANAANRLSSSSKGRLGEAMGDAKSTIGGQRRVWTPKSRDYIAEGDYWYPDGRSGPMRFEDKFGYGAELSRNQTRAQAALGANFKLYHFTPDDIGGIVSMPAAAVGARMVNSDTRGGTRVAHDPKRGGRLSDRSRAVKWP